MIRLGVIALLCAMLIAPVRSAQAADDPLHPFFDPALIEHMVSGVMRTIAIEGTTPTSGAAPTAVVLDSAEAAQRFIETLAAWLALDTGSEPVSFALPELPEH